MLVCIVFFVWKYGLNMCDRLFGFIFVLLLEIVSLVCLLVVVLRLILMCFFVGVYLMVLLSRLLSICCRWNVLL